MLKDARKKNDYRQEAGKLGGGFGLVTIVKGALAAENYIIFMVGGLG